MEECYPNNPPPSNSSPNVSQAYFNPHMVNAIPQVDRSVFHCRTEDYIKLRIRVQFEPILPLGEVDPYPVNPNRVDLEINSIYGIYGENNKVLEDWPIGLFPMPSPLPPLELKADLGYMFSLTGSFDVNTFIAIQGALEYELMYKVEVADDEKDDGFCLTKTENSLKLVAGDVNFAASANLKTFLPKLKIKANFYGADWLTLFAKVDNGIDVCATLEGTEGLSPEDEANIAAGNIFIGQYIELSAGLETSLFKQALPGNKPEQAVDGDHELLKVGPWRLPGIPNNGPEGCLAENYFFHYTNNPNEFGPADPPGDFSLVNPEGHKITNKVANWERTLYNQNANVIKLLTNHEATYEIWVNDDYLGSGKKAYMFRDKYGKFLKRSPGQKLWGGGNGRTGSGAVDEDYLFELLKHPGENNEHFFWKLYGDDNNEYVKAKVEGPNSDPNVALDVEVTDYIFDDVSTWTISNLQNANIDIYEGDVGQESIEVIRNVGIWNNGWGQKIGKSGVNLVEAGEDIDFDVFLYPGSKIGLKINSTDADESFPIVINGYGEAVLGNLDQDPAKFTLFHLGHPFALQCPGDEVKFLSHPYNLVCAEGLGEFAEFHFAGGGNIGLISGHATSLSSCDYTTESGGACPDCDNRYPNPDQTDLRNFCCELTNSYCNVLVEWNKLTESVQRDFIRDWSGNDAALARMDDEPGLVNAWKTVIDLPIVLRLDIDFLEGVYDLVKYNLFNNIGAATKGEISNIHRYTINGDYLNNPLRGPYTESPLSLPAVQLNEFAWASYLSLKNGLIKLRQTNRLESGFVTRGRTLSQEHYDLLFGDGSPQDIPLKGQGERKK